MKSTKRGRARARLSKGVLTENVIFSNGLGVCRLVPGAGQNSVCKRRSRVPVRSPATIHVHVTASNPPELTIYSNISGASVTLVGSVGGAAVISLPFNPASPTSIGGMTAQSFTLAATAGFADGIELSKLVLTLTGGEWYPGNWTGHTVTNKSIPDFVIDTTAPAAVSNVVTDAEPTKIVVTCDASILVDNPTGVAPGFSLSVSSSGQTYVRDTHSSKW